MAAPMQQALVQADPGSFIVAADNAAFFIQWNLKVPAAPTLGWGGGIGLVLGMISAFTRSYRRGRFR